MRFLKIPPRFLLPLLIFAGVLMTFARVQDAHKAAQILLFSPVQAEESKKEEPATTEESKAEQKDEIKTEEHAAATPSVPPPPPKREEIDENLYKSLAGRRDQLDARAKELDAREALVAIAEKRIGQKMQEMETLKGQLQTLLGQASASQAAQIENLVKIYETMKPKEAARIFESLEMPILLNVIQRMKPARTAAIMAEMDPLRAKELTVALTKQDQLPKVK